MVKSFESSDLTTRYLILRNNWEESNKKWRFVHSVCWMISGLARQHRPANRAGQRPSDWGAIPRGPPKTSSRCQGSSPRRFILTERSKQLLTQHVAVLQQIKDCLTWMLRRFWEFLFIPSSSLFLSSLPCSPSQKLLGGNVRWLHLPLFVGEPARMPAVHQTQLQRDRQWVHPGNTGSDAENRLQVRNRNLCKLSQTKHRYDKVSWPIYCHSESKLGCLGEYGLTFC